MKRLEGKVAVVTGRSSGIRLATAQRFVEESAYVFIIGRRQSEVDAAVKQIGNNVIGVQGDVSNLASPTHASEDQRPNILRHRFTVKEQKGQINYPATMRVGLARAVIFNGILIV